MVLKIYIGYAPHLSLYYVNRHGIDVIDKNARSFRDINSLLNYLTMKYNERKAFVKGISEDIPEDVRERILNHIKSKVRRLSLKERVSY